MGTGTPPPRLDGQYLPCGADIDDLLEQVAAGRTDPDDGHQAHCPHCQAALTEFAALWAPVRDLADQPVPTPTGLVAGVMHHIEKLSQNVWYTLHLADTGAIRVATRVVAAVARRAALRVPGVRVALGRSSTTATAKATEAGTRLHRHPHTAVGVLGRTAVVELAVTVTYGQSIPDVARHVQQRVTNDLRRDIGLRDVVVNVTVDEVLPPPSS
jgi:uncharacterized alkaline shock family protein YloU